MKKTISNRGNGIISIIVIVAIIWGISFLFHKKDDSYDSSSSYSYSKSDCHEPENTYSYGTGHYAGFEWAENNGGGYCNGNSNSFNEGCEDYNYQEEAYDSCVNN